MDKQELDSYRWLDSQELQPSTNSSPEQGKKLVQKLLDHLDFN